MMRALMRDERHYLHFQAIVEAENRLNSVNSEYQGYFS